LPITAVLLLVAALALGFAVAPLIGVIGVAVVGYVDYHLLKFYRLQLSSFVEIAEEELICKTPIGERVVIRYSDITHAGRTSDERGARSFFVYAEGEDQLLNIPSEYGDFDSLVGELEATLPDGVEERSYSLEKRQTLADKLKEEVVGTSDAADGEEPTQVDSSE
jgi:hypothetical protein